MVRRRLRQAGTRSLAGNHSFRATGITNYLKMAASSNSPSKWPPMPARARRPYMTGEGTRFPWMRSNGFPIERQPLVKSVSVKSWDRKATSGTHNWMAPCNCQMGASCLLALSWLNTANADFSGKTPRIAAQTDEGKAQVLGVLFDLEHGFPAVFIGLAVGTNKVTAWSMPPRARP
jgi:hypothetical protein